MSKKIAPVDLEDQIHRLVLAVYDEGELCTREVLPLSTNLEIKPGESVEITARPQFRFRGDRLAVWSVCAPYFMIESVRCGNKAAFVQAGSVPADAFATRLDMLPVLEKKLAEDGIVEIRISRRAEECMGERIAFPTLYPSQDFIIYVTNVGDRPMPFRGAVFGDVVG